MHVRNRLDRSRLFGAALALVLTGAAGSVMAAGGAPTRHEAGPWSGPRVPYKASNQTYRPNDAKETAEFARIEVATEDGVRPAGNPLIKGSNPFYRGER